MTDSITVVADLVEDLTLPARIQARALHTITANHTAAAVVALWGPAPLHCPGCGRDDSRPDDGCPIGLNPSMGEVQAWASQHSCGCWWGSPWEAVRVVDFWGLADPDRTADVEMDLLDAINVAAAALAEQVNQRDAELAEACRNRLLADLTEALLRLARGEDPLDVSTGDDAEPGVWCDRGNWEAWDYDPTSNADEWPTDTIAVTVEDIDDPELAATVERADG